ncbi:related to GTT1-glutathione S-transferase [Fusarium fujikuroi IMI 58289]|uniref:Related to GTT1-glutathione S-transferase n=1 Tax=Gibberella fujikuroi (strain CBS 195.34 / IMI 58289 / NRRL A-6831) TaxID=1279085 RepID=S0EAS7_GIBF5|nr:related to GTT1-glutathione S-transferase [Fusarium fujikuroi IMI 58289]KLP19676.1 GTT1-glutathione S-transferase [Fusarium fujikuroi]CCT71989.1 related to GTT1-glutathione S-transferase [Fusarium fujikuroi IMI 58289]SCO17836.1 related to GTT1-glutathione S-transferase [Fusarium fujikuroi]SCO41045.1 related to GTT1-glutathione S-transferase [Fusarium fujikuroi]SCO55464.1 related to GTT1-glutathione S-transferase [Fusarium fujikuroi]
MSSKQPDITLYFLNASRAIRIAWLLEELDISYKLVTSPRAANGLAPPEFKAKIPTRLGSSPVIQDGDLVIQESGAIVEYLIESYDSASRLLPQETYARASVREWIQASEGTFMMNAVPIIMARMGMPKEAAQYVSGLEAAIAPRVHEAMQWFEAELESGPTKGQFIVGTGLTAADIMMGFSIECIFAMKLGTESQDWPLISKWLANIKERKAYRTAVEKTGYSM